MVRYTDPVPAGGAAAPREPGQLELLGVDPQPRPPLGGVHEVVDPAIVRRVTGVRVAPVAVRIKDRVHARAATVAAAAREPLRAGVGHDRGEDVVGHAGEGGGGQGVDVATEDLDVGVGVADGGGRLEGLEAAHDAVGLGVVPVGGEVRREDVDGEVVEEDARAGEALAGENLAVEVEEVAAPRKRLELHVLDRVAGHDDESGTLEGHLRDRIQPSLRQFLIQAIGSVQGDPYRLITSFC